MTIRAKMMCFFSNGVFISEKNVTMNASANAKTSTKAIIRIHLYASDSVKVTLFSVSSP